MQKSKFKITVKNFNFFFIIKDKIINILLIIKRGLFETDLLSGEFRLPAAGRQFYDNRDYMSRLIFHMVLINNQVKRRMIHHYTCRGLIIKIGGGLRNSEPPVLIKNLFNYNNFYTLIFKF